MALNNDRSNGGVMTLVVLAVLSAVGGVILTVIGVRGREIQDDIIFGSPGRTFSPVPFFTGVGLLVLAVQIWIVLLVFWAWRWERRTTPLVDWSDALPQGASAVRRNRQQRAASPRADTAGPLDTE